MIGSWTVTTAYPRPSRLTYDDIREVVASFTTSLSVSDGPFVDVETIADVGLGIDIVPVCGLQRDCEVEAFLSMDRQTIFVDEDLANGPITNRYRFTVAHELGHWLLHRDLYTAASAHPSGIVEFGRMLPLMDRTRFELQADAFAGLLLVPSGPLATIVTEESLRASRHGFGEHGLEDEIFRTLVAAAIARRFRVSRDVILRRGEYDGLWTSEWRGRSHSNHRPRPRSLNGIVGQS